MNKFSSLNVICHNASNTPFVTNNVYTPLATATYIHIYKAMVSFAIRLLLSDV